MKKNAMALATAIALSATLGACGNVGGGIAGDTSNDEPTETINLTDKDIEEVTEDTEDVTDDTEDAEDVTDDTETSDDAKVDDNVDTDDRAKLRDDAEADGKTVLTGTVRMVDGPDIFEYEDIDPEMLGGKESEEGNTYAILELDEETTLSGMGADGTPRNGEKTDHIGLGNDMPKYDFTEDTASQWKKYDGKRICVAGDVWFPTDVSFPLSGRMSDAEVLYEE